ncbi:MAG: GHKL domain-containing protein [Propionivibrio sp.]|nr:GHKL domain-containing protein [Propionivibrio sp.]
MTTELSLSEAPLMTHADRTLLLQVIVNLLQNAIDAMEETEPSCRQLEVSSTEAADGAIVVSVSDQGVGIPEEIAVRLYTPLFTTKSHGLGLGLSICRSVVEAHGGRLMA